MGGGGGVGGFCWRHHHQSSSWRTVAGGKTNNSFGFGFGGDVVRARGMSNRTPGYGYGYGSGGGGGGGGGIDVKAFVAGALVGVAVGGGAVYKSLAVSTKEDKSAEVTTTTWRGTKQQRGGENGDGDDDDETANHPAMRMGWPVSTESLLRVHSGYVASFDARTRNPRWVLEVLNAHTCKGPGDRKRSNFVEDEAFGERFRNKLSDFRGSGYDRWDVIPL